MLDLLEETSGKVVIFAVFQTDIQELEKAIANKYGEGAVASYYGKTPQDERHNIIEKFQDPENELRYFSLNSLHELVGSRLPARSSIQGPVAQLVRARA